MSRDRPPWDYERDQPMAKTLAERSKPELPTSNLRLYPDWMMLGAEGVLDLIESDFGQSGRDVQLEAIRCQLLEAYERGMRQGPASSNIFDRYPPRTLLQKTESGTIVGMLPDGTRVVHETSEESDPCVSHVAMKEYERALELIRDNAVPQGMSAALFADRVLAGSPEKTGRDEAVTLTHVGTASSVDEMYGVSKDPKCPHPEWARAETSDGRTWCSDCAAFVESA